MQRRSIELTLEKVEELQALLDMDESVPDAGPDETLWLGTVNFEDDIEADIRIINSDSGPFVDALLTQSGGECCLLDPIYTLASDYEFEYEGETFIVEVLVKD